jgi:hypothetical protein
MGEDHAGARLQGGVGDGVPLIVLADEEDGSGPVPSPQKKVAYGTGRRPGGWGCLVQCDSIHRTRGSGPGGDTGSTNTRT